MTPRRSSADRRTSYSASTRRRPLSPIRARRSGRAPASRAPPRTRRVAGRHEQALVAIAHQLRDSGDVGRHDGQPGGHRLHEDDGDALGEARQREHVGSLVVGDEVVLADPPREPHAPADAEPSGRRLELRPQRAVADDRQVGVDAAGDQPGERLEQHRLALDRDEPSDSQDPKGRRGPRAPSAGGRVAGQVDSAAHDTQLRPVLLSDELHELRPPVAAHAYDESRIAHLRGERGGVRVVDVGAVRGEAPRPRRPSAGERAQVCGEERRVGRGACEVRVHVADPARRRTRARAAPPRRSRRAARAVLSHRGRARRRTRPRAGTPAARRPGPGRARPGAPARTPAAGRTWWRTRRGRPARARARARPGGSRTCGRRPRAPAARGPRAARTCATSPDSNRSGSRSGTRRAGAPRAR